LTDLLLHGYLRTHPRHSRQSLLSRTNRADIQNKGVSMDMSTLFSLKGRSALIPGGSRGLGRMIAEGFVQSGVRLYITARKAEACDGTAAELSEQGTCVS